MDACDVLMLDAVPPEVLMRLENARFGFEWVILDPAMFSPGQGVRGMITPPGSRSFGN